MDKLQVFYDVLKTEKDKLYRALRRNGKNTNEVFHRWWQTCELYGVLFQLVHKDIYPTDSPEVQYNKHVLWMLVQRMLEHKKRFEELKDKGEPCGYEKSLVRKFKRQITKQKKHLNAILKAEEMEYKQRGEKIDSDLEAMGVPIRKNRGGNNG